MPITDLVQELMIVKGLPPAPGDPIVAEQPIVTLDLMATDTSGWSLDVDEGWNPIIPSLKGGGVWSDSAVASGRQLLSNEESNVVETMHLTVTGDNAVDLARHFRNMSRMIQAARDFWVEGYQMEPVYLRWYAPGAPGAQFAPIYNIEMAIVEPTSWAQNIRDVTITIERYPYWFPLPPGTSPKAWSYIQRGDEYNYTNLSLDDNGTGQQTGHLAEDLNLINKREWNTTQSALVSQNFIEIAANLIPGDVPALCCIVVNGNSSSYDSMFISRQAIVNPLKNKDGNERDTLWLLNAGDNAGLHTDTTVQADTGAPASNSSASGQRTRCTFATVATMDRRFSWAAAESDLDLTLFRGSYAVFIRTRNSAAGTVQIKMRYGYEVNSGYIETPTMSLTDAGAGGTGNTTEWGFLYLGTIKIPLGPEKASSGIDGRGVNVLGLTAGNYNLFFQMWAARTSGTPEWYVSDMLLVPLDEPGVLLIAPDLSTANRFVIDNTGYFTHGKPEDYAAMWAVAGSGIGSPQDVTTVQGRLLTLIPGQKNRVHFFGFENSTKRSIITQNLDVWINIMPRWRYIRDV